jgi:Peptidase M10 serralysin C terminal
MTSITATQALDMSQLQQQFANFGPPSLVGIPSPTEVTLHSSTLNIDVTLIGTVGLSSITIATIHVESPPGSTAFEITDLSRTVPISFNPSLSFTFPDPLDSLAGSDSLVGSAFGDVLIGLGGNDVLLGNEGSDTLRGGIGKDTMTGGADADIFDFDSKAESVKGVDRDSILDFSGVKVVGVDHDRIDLRTIDAVKGPHNQAFKYIGAQKFHHIAGELQVKYNATADVAVVSGDIDGNGKADFQIEVHSPAALAKADFLL